MISKLTALNTSARNITFSAKITCEVYSIYKLLDMTDHFIRLRPTGIRITDPYNSFYIGNEVPTIYKATNYLLILLHMICKMYADFYSLCMALKMVEWAQHFWQSLIYSLL